MSSAETSAPFDPNADEAASAVAEAAWLSGSRETCDHGCRLWEPCSGCNVLGWNTPS